MATRKLTRKNTVTRFVQLNDHLIHNRTQYIPGHSFSRNEFVKRYGFMNKNLTASVVTIKDYRRFNKVMTEINDFIGNKGLAISSSDNYTNFTILDNKAVSAKAQTMRISAAQLNRTSVVLNQSLQANPNQRIGKGVPKKVIIAFGKRFGK